MSLLLRLRRRGRSYLQRALLTQRAALLAYWRQAEASGALLDASGNARNGTYSNVTLGAAGIGDGSTAASYNGTTSYANAYSASLAGAFNGAAGTIAGWVCVSADTVWSDLTIRRMLMFQADANNRAFIQRESSSGQFGWYYIAGGTTKSVTLTQNFSRNWLHVALTWNKAQDRARAYIDGIQTGADMTGLGTFAGALASTTVALGAANTTPSQPWSGRLAHAAAWGAELTAAEVAALHAAGRYGSIVFEGDSRMVGSPGTIWVNPPAVVSGTLTQNWQVANVATAGESVNTMNGQIASQVAPKYNSAIPRNVAVLWGGVNDNTTAATMFSRIQAWHTAVRALGFRTVVCTEIDCQSAAHTSWHTTEYQALNVLLRAAYPAREIADLGANANLQDATNTTYYNADKTHLTTAGYAVAAGIIAAAVTVA